MDFEQRVNIKFCCKLHKNAKEAHEMLKSVYGDNVVTLKTIYKWYERFKSGNESVEDEQRSGRPSTSKTDENVQKVEKMFRSNRRLTIRELTEEMKISYGSVQSILADNLKIRLDRRSIGKRKRNTSEEGLKLKDTENSPERFQTDDNLHEKSLETAATCGFSIFSDNSNTVPSQTPETNEDADPLQFNESNNGEFPLSIIDHKNVSRSSQIMENENKEIEIRDNEKIKLCKNRNNESTITDHLQSQERLSNHVFIQNLDDPLRPPSHFVDNPSCSQSYETEFDLFGKSVAKQLNNMQLNDALQAQLKIQEFLTNFRLRRLSRRPTPNNSSIETPSQCDDNIDVKMEIVDFI